MSFQSVDYCVRYETKAGKGLRWEPVSLLVSRPLDSRQRGSKGGLSSARKMVRRSAPEGCELLAHRELSDESLDGDSARYVGPGSEIADDGALLLLSELTSPSPLLFLPSSLACQSRLSIKR